MKKFDQVSSLLLTLMQPDALQRVYFRKNQSDLAYQTVWMEPLTSLLPELSFIRGQDFLTVIATRPLCRQAEDGDLDFVVAGVDL